MPFGFERKQKYEAKAKDEHENRNVADHGDATSRNDVKVKRT